MMELGVGAVVDGKVTGITKFGAFVSLPDGRSGLVHISIKQVEPRPQRAPRPNGGGRPRQPSAPRPVGFVRQPPKEPTDFEDRLKQFMQSSDSKLSELRYIEKKGGNRRGGGRRS